MALADIPRVQALLNEYLRGFHLFPNLNQEEVQHWFLPRDGVVDTYVVEVSLLTSHNIQGKLFAGIQIHPLPCSLLCFGQVNVTETRNCKTCSGFQRDIESETITHYDMNY